MTRPRDNQRSRVYAWERTIKGYHARPDFKTLEECQSFLAPIWRAERGRYGRARVACPSIERPSWGQRRALAHTSHRITLPLWARHPTIILHEATHLLTPLNEAHGPRFVGVMIGLFARHLGYDASELMALADEAGVKYDARSIGKVPAINLSQRLVRTVKEHGPMSEMDLACWLDCSYLQVRAAAMTPIKQGAARWLRHKLVLNAQPS